MFILIYNYYRSISIINNLGIKFKIKKWICFLHFLVVIIIIVQFKQSLIKFKIIKKFRTIKKFKCFTFYALVRIVLTTDVPITSVIEPSPSHKW